MQVPAKLLTDKTQFIFRPGGADEGYFYSTWARLYQDFTLAKGDKAIFFDTSIAPATIPAGTYDFSNGSFNGYGLTGYLAPTVTVADGVSWTNLNLIQDVNLDCQNTTAPIEVIGAGRLIDVINSQILANGTFPVWTVSGSGAPNFAFLLGAGLGQTPTTSPGIVALPGAQIFLVMFSGAFIGDNKLASIDATGSLFNFLIDPGAGVSNIQGGFTGAVTYAFASQLASINYNPNNSNDWGVFGVPSNAAQATDSLAANQVQQRGNEVLSGGVVTVLSPFAFGGVQILVTNVGLAGISAPAALAVGNIVDGVSFDIISADPADDSVIAYVIYRN